MLAGALVWAAGGGAVVLAGFAGGLSRRLPDVAPRIGDTAPTGAAAPVALGAAAGLGLVLLVKFREMERARYSARESIWAMLKGPPCSMANAGIKLLVLPLVMVFFQ